MPVDKIHNYRVLRAVSFLQPKTAKEGGVTSEAVSNYTGISERRARAVCGHLSSQDYDCGNPWLYKVAIEPSLYRVSTGGELELDGANEDPRLPTDEMWIDKVRWPYERRYSDLKNVAIPTGSSRGGTMDPDHAAWKRNRGALADFTSEEDEQEFREAWRKL